LTTQTFEPIDISKWILPSIFIFVLFVLPPTITALLSILNNSFNTGIINIFRAKYMDFGEIFNKYLCATLSFDNFYGQIFLGIVGFEISAFALAILGIECYMLNFSFRHLKNQSKRKISMHKELVFAIVLQVNKKILTKKYFSRQSFHWQV